MMNSEPEGRGPHRRDLLARVAGLGMGAGLGPSLGALLGPTAAQARNQASDPAAAQAGASAPAGQNSGADTLLGRKDRTSRLSTKVMINGEGPFDFVVDTGANSSVISSELAEKLKLAPGGPARIHGISGVQPAATVNVRSFKAGLISIPVQDVPILKSADLGCDGLLGIDAFRDRRVTLDFQRNVVELARSRDLAFHEEAHLMAAVTSEVTVSARQRFGQLTIIDAEASRRKITCFIDTGAQRTVGNLAMRRAVQAVTADARFTPIKVVIHGATGQEAPGEVAEVPTMRLGGVHFTAFPMAFADLHTFDLWQLSNQPAVMLGMDLLRLFEQVAIDFGKREVRFRMAEFLPLPSARA